MEAQPWNMKQVPTEEFYARAAPPIPAAALDELDAEAGGRAKSRGRKRPRPENDPRVAPKLSPRDSEERRKLRQRVRALVDALGSHVPVEARRVEQLAREQHVGVDKLLELARALGAPVSKRDDWLKPGAVRALMQMLNQGPDDPGRQKDNGPQQEPVV
jgi:hypothetical protein